MSNPIARIAEYYRRHGLKHTIHRASVAFKRALFANRMVVFYCDLSKLKAAPVNVPASLKIERVADRAELSAADLQEMTSFWNPKQALENIQERFEKGASLWLVRSGDVLAGYGWTIRGRTIAEYYFLIGADDVQLFDFHVFPKFRGRALHWLLTVYILQTLAAEGGTRAFADTGEWNQAQLASFKMTPFRRLGMVKSFTIAGRTFVSWVERETAPTAQHANKAPQQTRPVPNAVRLHE